MNYLTVQSLQVTELPKKSDLRLAMGYSEGIRFINDSDWEEIHTDSSFLDDLIQLHVVNEEAAYFVWQRDGEWITTRCCFRTIKENNVQTFQREQQLLWRSEALVVNNYLDFDQDGQAYIAYTHPSQLKVNGGGNG